MEDDAPTAETPTADATDTGAGGAPAGGEPSDVELVAQIEAETKGGAPAGADSAAAGEEGGEGAAAAAGEEGGEGDEGADGGEGAAAEPDLARARKIMLAANRKLARAKELATRDRAEIAAALKKNPLKTLRELGTNIKEVLDAGEQESDGGEGSEKDPTTEERVDALERQRVADAQAAAQAKVHRLTEQAHEVIKGAKAADGKELYPRINRGEAHELVTELCIAYHAQHGVALPLSRAAKQVEDYLATIAGETPAPAKAKAAAAGVRQPSQTLTNTAIRNVAPAVADDLPVDDDDARHVAVMKELGLKTA